jgi:hypothetical protein
LALHEGPYTFPLPRRPRSMAGRRSLMGKRCMLREPMPPGFLKQDVFEDQGKLIIMW